MTTAIYLRTLKEEYHLYSDTFVNKLHIIDPTNNQSAHLDAFQLIPDRSWLRYGLAYARNIIVSNTRVQSLKSNRNGIAGFDGLFKNVILINNTIDTASKHSITINGLMSGTFLANTNSAGQPCTVTLNPWRIGGGQYSTIDVPFLWVVHTSVPIYEPVMVDAINALKDLRTEPQVDSIGSVSVTDFNIPKFKDKHPKSDQYVSLESYITDLRSLALDCSKLLT